MTKTQYWQQVADWHKLANRRQLYILAMKLTCDQSQHNLWNYQEAEGMGSELAARRFDLFGSSNKAN